MTDASYTRPMASAAPMTAEELLRLNLPDKRTELVRGRLVVREPAGHAHGRVAMRIGAAIAQHVQQHRLGETFAAETGFTLQRDPDTVRAPDVAFVASTRLSQLGARGYADIPPDLAVEVLSPDDRPGEVLQKVGDWLSAGCRLVWILDPIRRTGTVYRADGTMALLGEHDAFDGEDVLPAFRSQLTTLL
ncbi:MAG: Uma2 family endonuclease [Gemmatimonadaceae bacterium]|nr:Uma2 family endonuclease [Gemmatimonadaceae bacterium]